MPCSHTYKPQLIEHVRETCYGPHSVTPGGVPNTNIVLNVPRLPNSLASYRGGQSFWIHPYEPKLAYSYRQYSPIRATTQGFLVFLRHPKPQLKECHVFNPYLESQLKGYVPSYNSRNTLARIRSSCSFVIFLKMDQGFFIKIEVINKNDLLY
ncbi:hypothetical protein DEO72_LG2g3880 [Vigna unguiculata]|uniref:Uncharacterized protein n=1 Tax=Vigna unguiculata TaxID=3917 RepID=A0A4D6L529_VIGUN|nr:hypothetical protein DEO72_LG2g3880 [Vigna unguiculata]